MEAMAEHLPVRIEFVDTPEAASDLETIRVEAGA
jgi:hypothetical protein